MNKKGLTLVESMLSVAIIILLIAIAIPAVKRMSNERAARASVLSLSAAAETYAKSHSGVYPARLDELTASVSSAPDFCSDLSGKAVKSSRGYNYKCISTAGGYTFEASPITSGITGSVTYTVTTGGGLAHRMCVNSADTSLLFGCVN